MSTSPVLPWPASEAHRSILDIPPLKADIPCPVGTKPPLWNVQLAPSARWPFTCNPGFSSFLERSDFPVMSIEIHGVSPLVQVFDMPRSIRFYRDVLGFTVTGIAKAKSDDPDDVDWVMLQLCDATVMLNTAYDPDDVPDAPEPGRWSGHQDTTLYFGCPDVDAAYRCLVEKGLDVKPPKVAWYGMKQLYLTDPDGFGICFQWKA